MAEAHIKEKSKQLFFSYGMISVSMNDIAQMCCVSKKSIYQYFEDKNTLVCAIVHELIQSHKRLLKICRVAAKNAIDEVIKQSAEPFEIWAAIRPSFFYELEKFFPQAWHELEQYRLKLYNGITHNLEWGRQEGFYRTNINTALVAELRLLQLTHFLQQNFATTQQWSSHQSVMELTSLYLHSIAAEKGTKRLYTIYKNNH